MKKSPASTNLSKTPKQQNTLLNYFQRTPKSAVQKQENETENNRKRIELSDRSNHDDLDAKISITTPKRKTIPLDIENDDDDDDEIIIKRSVKKSNKKFKRIFQDSDSDDDHNNEVTAKNQNKDDDDYQPAKDEESPDDDDEDEEIVESSDFDEEEEEITPPSKKSKKTIKSAKKSRKHDDFICDDDQILDDIGHDIGSNNKLSDLKLKTRKILSSTNQMPEKLTMIEDQNISFKFVKIDSSNLNENIIDESSDINVNNIKEQNDQFAVLNDEKFLKKTKICDSNPDKAILSEEAANVEWPHLTYKFLQPKYIKDLNGNRLLINDDEINPDYDPSTLYVPTEFLQQQTPAMRQWWELKSKNYDTVLFFKMGKFYEFFHMDAVLCARELKILFMRGTIAHAGFPEKSYKQYADALVQKGYKVARVEQTETPEMMTERCKQMKHPTKFDRVVNREICRISSLGTRFMSDIDADTFVDCDQYLFAITCKEHTKSSYEFGLCFVDVSIGKFFLSQFVDDRYNSKLRTLIAHHKPSEILIEKSNKFLKLVETLCSNARLEKLKKFESSGKILKYLYEKNLLANIPDSIRHKILDPSDVLQQTPQKDYELSIISLGAIINYLEKSLIIDDIISMKQFELYHPPEFNINNDSTTIKLPNHMIVDSMSMKNLELIQSLSMDERSLTLFKIIDNCQTIFGKRLLRKWLCQPLCGQRKELERRHEAIKDLAENNDLICFKKHWKEMLKKIPDLDRLLTQIHSQSSLTRSKNHPDSRAILFESNIYRMRKIKTFLNTIDGFEQILKFIDDIQSKSDLIRSKYILQLITYQNNNNNDGLFPEIKDKIKIFHQLFEEESLRKDGKFIPNKGIDANYDDVCDRIIDIENKLKCYLDEQKLYFKTRITYVNALKNRYLLEIPDSCESKVSKSDEKYELKSSRKGFKRYYTPELLKLIEELEYFENEKQLLLNDLYRKLLERFDKDYQLWHQAISCVAQFDVLLSLSNTKQLFESNDSQSCLPTFIWNNDNNDSIICAKNLRNAFLLINNNVIPNDIELKNETLILTGPNMGGKTTLMRSVGLLVILAQIGCYVPASECQLTPVDRIFTRIGAYDIILENESTFMVELSEASLIIKYATRNSLALIDELGSGTSTFDGTSIASTIIFDLAEKIRCRTLFSTHYHSILDELNHKSNIKLGYMSYMIENENDKDPTDENIIFLYKLQSGICHKSYGFNVAKLAGIPTSIIRNAYKHSKRFELECQIKTLLNWFRQYKQQNSKNIDYNSEQVRANLEQISSKIEMLRKLKAADNCDDDV